ncbi:MAG TPA: hypothetical protein PKY82_16725 [Pyrinomonadaceae bacterium]|nr:hypothetical protein [Pyrinomonadaceae bacterium]
MRSYRITRDCWGRYGESGWLYALLIILFEWFIKLLMVIISLFFLVGEFSKRKNNKGWIATIFLIGLNPVLSIFVAIATHLYGEVARAIHLLIYGCGCFTGG